jgi:PAS domain S-box-containing protein
LDGSKIDRQDDGNPLFSLARASFWTKLALTVILCLLALLVTLSLPGSHSNPVFLLFMVAVALSAWVGGWRCGALAVMLVLLAEFCVILPVIRYNLPSVVVATRYTAMVTLMIGTAIVFSLLRAASDRTRELLAKEKQARAAAEAAIERHRQAEELLQRYELIASEGRDIILFMRHQDGRLLEANAAAVRSYGYTHEELLSMTIHDLRAPETRPQAPAQMLEASLRGILFETVHQRKDGNRFPVEVNSHGADIGGVKLLISIVRDITARKQAEEAQRAQMATLQGILDATRESVWLFDPDGTVVLGNQTGLRRLKRSAEEVIGGTFYEFLPPALAASRHADIRRVFSTGQPAESEDERNGTTFQHHYYPIFDPSGKVVRVAAFSRDVTEHRRAAAAEARSMQRLQRVLSSITDGFYALDAEWRFVAINPLAAIHFGRPAADLIGRNLWDLAGTPEDNPLHRRYVEAAVSGEPLHFETQSLVNPGTWWELHLQPVEDGLEVYFRDITERKRAEIALRESEERFRRVFENAPIGIVLTDWIGHIVQCNSAFLDMLGYQRMDDLPATFLDLVHPEDREVNQADAVRLRLGEIPSFIVENRYLRRDGEPVWVRKFVSVLPNDAGEPAFTVALVTDMTEARLAEEKLRNRERIYRAIGESINYGIWVNAPDGRNIYASDSFLKLVGMTQQQCSDFGWGDVLHPDEAAATVAAWKECVRVRGVWDTKHRYRGVDGRYHYILARGVPVLNDRDEVIYWAGINLDISRQKQVESALRESEERLSLVIQSAALGTWDSDLGSGQLIWSPRSCELFGVPPGQPLTFERFLELIHPDDRERIRRQVQTAIERHEDYDAEMRTLWPDGSLHWVSARGRAYYDAAGQPVRMSGAAQDITARKQAEEALLRSEKLASVGRMAAAVAHEINNPLASVMNLIYLATHAPGLPAAVRANLEMADAELRRVAHIARQSLGFYREVGAPALTSVNQVLESTVDLLQAKIRQRRAVIEKQWKGEFQLLAVAGELRQVFSNLLANSLDAIDDAGVIKLRVSSCRLGRAGRRAVCVTVADNGRGVKPRDVPRLFEPFFTTKGSLGTGLGLWVSKQIVDKHGGSIRVHSRTAGPRAGTSVSVVLPLGDFAVPART